jgi:hypothetical protein
MQAFQTHTCIVTATAPTENVRFEWEADAIMQMWNTIFGQNQWS